MSEAQDRAYQPKAKVQEHPQLDESTGFDYRVHVKDAKTGKLIRIQHYARHAHGNDVLLERPPGSGNCFYENGRPAGRYKFTTEGNEIRSEKISDKHVEVAAAPVDHMDELTQKNEMLERELELLRAEVAKKQEHSTAKQDVQKK